MNSKTNNIVSKVIWLKCQLWVDHALHWLIECVEVFIFSIAHINSAYLLRNCIQSSLCTPFNILFCWQAMYQTPAALTVLDTCLVSHCMRVKNVLCYHLMRMSQNLRLVLGCVLHAAINVMRVATSLNSIQRGTLDVIVVQIKWEKNASLNPTKRPTFSTNTIRTFQVPIHILKYRI